MGQFSAEKPVAPGSVLSGNQRLSIDSLFSDVQRLLNSILI